MKKIILTLTIVVSTVVFSKAQTTAAPGKTFNVFFGLNFDLGIPNGEFKTINDEIAVGGGFNLFFQPSYKIPVLIGFDLAFLGNGRKTQRETLVAEIKAGDVVIETLYFPLRAETYNSITKGHLNLRVQSPTKFFKPYIDGLVGFNHFGTTTSIYDESEELYFSEDDNPLISSTSQNSSWAFSYGGAVGLMVEINENMLIDVRFAYTLGGEAEYYVEDDIEQWEIEFNTSLAPDEEIDPDDISIAAFPKESKTDMILGTVGLTFKF